MPNLQRTIACHGLSIQVPPDWSLAAISSQTDGGYFRLDDDYMPRLEVKWARPQPSALHNLPEIKQRCVSALRRAAKKSHTDLVLEDRAQSLNREGRKAKNFLSFRWQTSQQGYTFASSCGSCGRQVLAQLYGPLDTDVTGIAEAVFSTLRDHSPDQWDAWSLYDFRFRVPSDFSLLSQKLLLGRLEFVFQRASERVVFSQWAVAHAHLADQSLPEWFRDHLASRAKGITFSTNETDFRGHPALFVQGRKSGYKALLQSVFAAAAKKRLASLLDWRLWHCVPLNRLFSVEAIVLPSNSDLPQQLAEGVKCH